jgi:hypothetical protein
MVRMWVLNHTTWPKGTMILHECHTRSLHIHVGVMERGPITLMSWPVRRRGAGAPRLLASRRKAPRPPPRRSNLFYHLWRALFVCCYGAGPGGESDKSRLEVHNRQGEDEAGTEAWTRTRAGRGRGQNKSVDWKPFRRRTQFLNLDTRGEKQRSDEEGKYRMGPRPVLK